MNEDLEFGKEACLVFILNSLQEFRFGLNLIWKFMSQESA